MCILSTQHSPFLHLFLRFSNVDGHLIQANLSRPSFAHTCTTVRLIWSSNALNYHIVFGNFASCDEKYLLTTVMVLNRKDAVISVSDVISEG